MVSVLLTIQPPNRQTIILNLGICKLSFGFLHPMRREFLLNILFLVFINLLIKPFFIFGIDRTIQNRVGLEEYGVYAALFNFTFLVSIVNDFGLPSFTSQRISQNRALFPTYFPNILILKIGLSILYGGLVLALAWGIGYDATYFSFIGFLLINQILLSFVLYFRSSLSGLGQYRIDSCMSVLERSLLIVLCAFLLWFNPWNTAFQIEWFIYAQTISLAVAAIVGGGLVAYFSSQIIWKIDTALLKQLVKQSLPYALAIFLMTVYTRVDFVMLERIAPQGKTQAGIYAMAYRLLDAVNVIGLLFAGLLLPMLTRQLKNKEDIRPLVQLSARLLFWGTILVTCLVGFYRREIMDLLYIHTDQYAADILGILIITFNWVGGGYIFGTILVANNSLRQLNQLYLVSVFLNILLNYWVIPDYGAMGVACTTLLTQCFAFLGQLLLTKRLLSFPLDLPFFQQIGVYLLLLISCIGIVHFYLPYRWEVGFILLFLIAIVLGFLTKLLNIKGLLVRW